MPFSPSPVLILGAIASYLLGAVPFGLLFVRWFRKQDVRDSGSGNIGATNVTRVAGRKLGALTLALDAFKGWLPVVAGRLAGFDDVGCAIFGAAAFVGHCFPVYLRFRGGKGVATGFGVVAGMRPLVALAAAGVFVVTFVLTRISSVSCIAGVLAVAGVALVQGIEPSLLWLLLAMVGIIVIKLAPNLRRVWVGRELKF